MQPEREAFIAIGIPGTSPSGPGSADCRRCRARKLIALSTAVTIFDLKDQGITPVILCWDCLLKDPGTLAKIGALAAVEPGRALLGLNPLEDLKE